MLTSAERVCLLENRLFRGFLPAELDGLLESLSARAVSLPGNCVLWSMGDRVERAGIVLSGRVEAWRYTADGQACLSAVHEAGGLFGDVLMYART
ncbi:MAG: cyclic nucleotide-binding domain-containing protein, partial [Oscillospiraceae bacterium]|nr:cyclic nucleotide-binding domain-containing protein [Oscillospiraceae bacterium]